MKYQKYITVMQMAMGVTASNKDCLPVKRQLWVTQDDGDTASMAPHPDDIDGPQGASSTLSLPMSQGKPSLRRIKGRIHRSKSLDSMDLLDSGAAMEETVIWEQHTVTLHRAPGFGFGIAISGGRDNPHFQSGETSIVISDVLKGGPAEGQLQENDRVVMVNAVSMDNVEHAYAVQQLRKSGKNAKITIRRKRKIQLPVSRPGDRETMSEHEEDEEEESEDEEGYQGNRAQSAAYGGAGAGAGASGGGTARRQEREHSAGRRDRSASRDRSVSPRSERRSQASLGPPKPSKVTLVKSRKSEEYGLRLASHIFVKDISPESLAARDGNIQEGDVVLKINGTVTENLSLVDAKKLIERSKGKLKMVVQRDERATLLNVPDLDDSIPSGNNSDRDDISEIHSLTSEHSNRSLGRGSRSRSPDRSDTHDHPRHSPRQVSNGRLKAGSLLHRLLSIHRSRDEERTSKQGAMSTPLKSSDDGVLSQTSDQASSQDDKHTPPLPEPKPVYAQPGQPDVDLPVSPSDAPIPSAAHDESILRPSMKLVKFRKGESVGLRLAGGNDVGIFVAGVLDDSPAAKEGLEEGDQILRVNNVDFANIIREEAVLFLLDLLKGEEVTILAQKKKDVYRRIVESDVGDSFYIRTHFEYEKESAYGLSFNKGEVFRVVDTLYNGKLGSWLAIRIGKNHQEVERGIIPNKNRAEQLSSVQYTLPKTPGGDRADFWRFRGLRSSKRNLRKSREDLSAQPVQTKFPAYERVVLREAGFLRPVVIFGPIADAAREKLGREEPDVFELAKTQQQKGGEKSEPRDAGTETKNSGIIRLHTIKQIIDRDKHAVLDITPNAVDRLNYAQWYPIVVFLNPDSKQGVKTMRTRLCPESRKSARKLYDRSHKLRKNNHHLFTTTINLNNMNEGWYGALKENIQQQQNQLVWVSEGKADGAPDDDLDLHDDRLSYLSAPGSEYSMCSTDSRHTSDYEDTDTEGGAYTDQELDETLNDDVGGPPAAPAITRSSEPVRDDPPVIQEPPGYTNYHQPGPSPGPAAGHAHNHMAATGAVPADVALSRIDPAGFKAPPQQKAEAVLPSPPPQAEPAAPAALHTVNSVGSFRAAPAPDSGSLRRPPPERAPQSGTPEPLATGPPGPEPKMFQKDPYLDHGGRMAPAGVKPVATYDPQPPYQLDQPPYRDYDHLAGRYEGSSGGSSGYLETKYPAFDPQLPYENNGTHPDQPWSQYSPSPPATAGPQGYDPRGPYGDSPDLQPHPPQRYDQEPPAPQRYDQEPPAPQRYDQEPPAPQRYEDAHGPQRYDQEPPAPQRYEDAHGPQRYDQEPPAPQRYEDAHGPQRYDDAHPPQQGLNGRPRYGKPAAPAPLRYDEPLPPLGPPYDPRSRYDQDPQPYPPPAHSPEPPAALRYNQGPPPTQPQPQTQPQAPRGYKPPAQPYDLPPQATPSPPPPKSEAPSPPTEPALDQPALKHQSVLNRVKMFENKRSVSVDRVNSEAALNKAAELPVKPGGSVPKANSLSNLDQEKNFRAPEPQRPQSKMTEDIVRANHHNPDEEEEYYREQLAYLDTMQTGTSKALPQGQAAYSYPSSTEGVGAVEKRYDVIPQGTPAVRPGTLTKPTVPEIKAPARDETVHTNFLPHKSFPEKTPVNGTSELPAKLPSSGPAAAPSYNRYVAKPYTTSARPFERKFDSPKFNHNLLPHDKPEPATKINSSPAKVTVAPQSQSTDQDSGLDTFTRTMDQRSKYQPNNIHAVPKAIPVSPSALEDEGDEEGHTVVATARGVFNCNGGVLSSIETGVSIIIPQGAIPDGVEQEIYFKVCRDNSILPPLDKEKGETLLSPLVMCGPHGLKFQKPVELRLPHCASMTPDGDPKSWQNKSLPGDPNYLVGANCVSVLIDHF
ncbi:tight junction protein ZO-1 isoform X3 [Gadus morhua]|uniref:Tight junction protein 1a n=1 Tax=Gadus morhua TaxID=8049 RepID=A0A8C5CNX4_GADMO|nr:tight junction protein ZO-1-like isoform X3 [Gadus morhua]